MKGGMKMKKILSLLFVCFLLVGCGGAKEEDPNRLSKDDYLQQVTDKMMDLNTEINSMTSKISDEKSFNDLIENANSQIDEIIALQGPSNLDEKEKVIDEKFEDFKGVLTSAKDLIKDPSKISEYVQNVNKVANELGAAEQDYRK